MNIIKASDEGPLIAGKILLLTAIVISSIPYGLYFSWLFYIPGLIFLWNSKLRKKQKWQWTTISLTIWLPIMFLFVGLSLIIAWL